MEFQHSSTPPDQFARQGEPQTRALHPFSVPFRLAPEKRCRPTLQIFRSHRSAKALTGELQNAMVAPVTPSKTELNRHGSIGVLAGVVEQLIQRQEIMHGVWGENFYGDDNLLDVYIRYLRQKVELDDAPTLIQTVRGVGFILREQSS